MKVKICGLSRPCDIEYVNLVKPEYIGFVFAKSKRQVTMEQAQSLRQSLHCDITPVGVFVDAPIAQIKALYEAGVIAMAQLHGQESEGYLQRLKTACQIPIMKAIAVERAEDVEAWQASCAEYLLLDQGRGGTGKSFDWGKIPICEKPFFLAGGIQIEMVEAARGYAPYALDVSSGVEVDGKKNQEKIEAFVRKVRGEESRGFYY